MKFKSINLTLSILLFIIGIIQFIMLFMKIEAPGIMTTISEILLITIIISSSIKTLKLRKLAYPIIIIFYFFGMPIIESFIYNRPLYIGLTILSFLIVMIFISIDITLTTKEKKLTSQ